jgi:hypothetical protein
LITSQYIKIYKGNNPVFRLQRSISAEEYDIIDVSLLKNNAHMCQLSLIPFLSPDHIKRTLGVRVRVRRRTINNVFSVHD